MGKFEATKRVASHRLVSVVASACPFLAEAVKRGVNAANSVTRLRALWSEAEEVKARSFFLPIF
jgi:hypothetical protein